MIPIPSARESGDPTTVPAIEMRVPSRDSVAAAVATDAAGGSPADEPPPIADSARRSVRCENREDSDPVMTTAVPAGHGPTATASR